MRRAHTQIRLSGGAGQLDLEASQRLSMNAEESASRRKHVALITGGSRGIGRATAAEFAAHGHPLALVARNGDALLRAAEALRSDYGVPVTTYPLDITVKGAPERLQRALARDDLNVRYLVNNAGYWSRGSVELTPIDDLERVVSTNILAPLRLAKTFLPQLAAANGGILWMSSLAALMPTPAFASYGASKAFITAVSVAMQHECRARKIMVCVVLPGLVRTDFVTSNATSIWYRMCASAPETVARAAYRGFLSGQATVVPGLLSRVMYFGIKSLPAPVTQGIFHVASEQYH